MTTFNTPDQTEAAFYAAFEATDLARMLAVWGTGGDVVCIHPGGDLLQGLEPVAESWRAIFAGARPPAIEHRSIRQTAAGDLAIHLVEERIGPRGAGAPTNRILATNVYRRGTDGWRLVLHHASLPLVAGHAVAEAAPERVH